MEDNEKQFVTSEDLIKEGIAQGRIQGIAFAIAMMYKGEQEKDIWKSWGMSIQGCIDNEVAEFDMEELLKHQDELDGQ